MMAAALKGYKYLRIYNGNFHEDFTYQGRVEDKFAIVLGPDVRLTLENGRTVSQVPTRHFHKRFFVYDDTGEPVPEKFLEAAARKRAATGCCLCGKDILKHRLKLPNRIGEFFGCSTYDPCIRNNHSVPEEPVHGTHCICKVYFPGTIDMIDDR